MVIELVYKGQRLPWSERKTTMVFRLSAFLQGIENRAQTIVGLAYAGVVKGEFLTNLRIIEESEQALRCPGRSWWDRGLPCPRALATKGFVRSDIFTERKKASPPLALNPPAVDSRKKQCLRRALSPS